MSKFHQTNSQIYNILGVIGLFIALSLEFVVVSRVRAAKTTIQVHEWLTLSRVTDLVLPVSAVFILISGLVLTVTAWGWEYAWIDLSLGLLVLLSWVPAYCFQYASGNVGSQGSPVLKIVTFLWDNMSPKKARNQDSSHSHFKTGIGYAEGDE